MAARTAFSEAEQGLVDALRTIATDENARPRAAFATSLRDRIVAETQAMEQEEAERFQLALEGAPINGQLGALASFTQALAPEQRVTAPASLRFGLRAELAKVPAATGLAAAISKAGKRLSRRVALITAIGALSVSSGALVSVSAQSATPADGLFGVKRFTENVTTLFASGSAEGVRRLGFAERRIDETETMLERGITDSAPYERALDLFQSDVARGAELIIEAHRNGEANAAEAVPRLAHFLTTTYGRVVLLASSVPESARATAEGAIKVLETTAEQTEQAVSGCVICTVDATDSAADPDTCLACLDEETAQPPSSDERPRLLPRRDSGSSTKQPPGDGTTKPDGPTEPPPLPQPVPESTLLPPLPGDIDQELEDPIGSVVGSLKQLL